MEEENLKNAILAALQNADRLLDDAQSLFLSARLGAVCRMVLPLALPGLLTVVICSLTLVIQEFVHSLTFISSV